MKHNEKSRNDLINFILSSLNSNLSSPVQKDDFKIYFPERFKHLRDFFNVKDSIYKTSFINEFYVRNNAKKNLILFYTSNFNFVVKVISRKEKKFLLKILIDYIEYLKNADKSFMSRIYGCYRIKSEEYGTLYLIVMNSIFPCFSYLNEVYDLKGSFYNRHADNNSLYTLKDIDWMRRDKKLDILSKKDYFLKVIESDIDFLEKNNIMDYSLVIGIKYEDEPKLTNNYKFYQSREGNIVELKSDEICKKNDFNCSFDDFRSDKNSEDAVYYFGIIDILTCYTLYKRIENLILKCSCKFDASCVNPKKYKKRFLEMLKCNVFLCEK